MTKINKKVGLCNTISKSNGDGKSGKILKTKVKSGKKNLKIKQCSTRLESKKSQNSLDQDKNIRIEEKHEDCKEELLQDGSNDENRTVETSSVSLKNNMEFNEDNFNNIVNIKFLQNIVSELTKRVLEQISTSKNVFVNYKYMLDLTYYNIPRCPKRMVKLKLENSILSEEDDVILFVRDKRSSKFNDETTTQYYENLLREKGVSGIKTIMPFRQLKKEYRSYEMKIKLSNLYERYLCDGAIVGHVTGFLGKIFQKPRSCLYAVRMDSPYLANEIEKAKQKTCFKQGKSGSLISIPIGKQTMTPEQISENILSIVLQLKSCLPGSLPNIRNIYLKINIKGTPSLPIFINTALPPSEVPDIIGPKEKKLRELAFKSDKILTKFQMLNDGKLLPRQKEEKPSGEALNLKQEMKKKVKMNMKKKVKMNMKKLKVDF